MSLADDLQAIRDRAIAKGMKLLSIEEIDELLERASPSEAEQRVPLAPNVDGQDFYELCQAYRHSKEIMPHPSLPNTARAFRNLQEYIKTGKLPWPSYERQSAPEGKG